jgi:diaminopimelate decarboxylase
MKALPTRRILQIVADEGMDIDASSMNEARRAYAAGIPMENIQLTSQEIPDPVFFRSFVSQGMKYNVCSKNQLQALLSSNAKLIPNQVCIRLHPEKEGSGGNAATTTGGEKSCFGVHMTDVDAVLGVANSQGMTFNRVHSHVGSGGSPAKWYENIGTQLEIISERFPHVTSVSFGGGLKEARMPNEDYFDVNTIMSKTAGMIDDYAVQNGRKLHVEIEPGTYVVANAGFLPLQVIDRKKTGSTGYDFLVCNGGMEVSTRPLLYGSEHPLHVVSKDGVLLSSDFGGGRGSLRDHVVVGHCCESGDAQTLNSDGSINTRRIATPDDDDYIVVAGVGAYVSSMCLKNYNSHVDPAEVLKSTDGQLKVIRTRQTFEQMVQNEL